MLAANAEEFNKSVNFAGYMGQRIAEYLLEKWWRREVAC
jgi:hypothetical protein